MGANPSIRRRHAGPCKGIDQHAPDEVRRPERTVGRAQGDEQMPRPACPLVQNVVGNRFAHVDRQRHAVMKPLLAADRDLAGTPVDVVEPDRGDLLAAQAEPGQQKQDGAVAAPGRAFAVHGGDQTANLPGRKVARCAMPAPGRDLRHAQDKVAAGQPGGEHEPEHPAEIRRLLVQTLPAPRNSRWQGQEGAHVLRPDTVQVAGFLPEREDQKTPEELPACAGRGSAQPPLEAQPITIVRAQLLKPARQR